MLRVRATIVAVEKQ